MKKLITLVFFAGMILAGKNIIAQSNTEIDSQPPQIKCGTEEAMKEFYAKHPEALKEAEEFDVKIKELAQKTGTTEYFIPVIFHVFGTDFAGKTVSLSKIKKALEMTNKDFQGLNDDYATVDTDFQSIKKALNITFTLAELDPSGDSTTGVKFYEVKSGFGNGSGYDEEIKTYAWDNYKYMNVYIMLDLYDDGVTNNSGVSWYPDKWMSDNNLSRVVYNGRYIYGNTDKEFASVLTHEFGHWLNLKHTFEGGCTYPNDGVADTPPCTQAQGCKNINNCEGNEVNGENYMDYNATCYKMFTKGQVDRMIAALNLSTRKTLWGNSNLEATVPSVLSATGISNINTPGFQLNLYPNPNKGSFTLEINSPYKEELTVNVLNNLGLKVWVHEYLKNSEEFKEVININDLPGGLYTVRVVSEGKIVNINKMIIE